MSTMKTWYKWVSVICGLLILFSAGIIYIQRYTMSGFNSHVVPLIPKSDSSQTTTAFSYSGEAGKDALTLLQKHATVRFSQPGMVNSINGREADNAKHEYWAFYVNGKLAQVGAADYQTKTGDQIMWKIETY